jgi:hypothetical protein
MLLLPLFWDAHCLVTSFKKEEGVNTKESSAEAYVKNKKTKKGNKES